MKRFLTTILCVLCVLAAYAVSYGTSYRGSGNGGVVYTTSSARAASIGSGGVVASAPMAAMSSTSLYNGRGIASNISQISGIRTSASGIVGGVTTFKAGDRGHGGDAEECPHCIDLVDNETGKPNPETGGGDGRCDICWHDMDNCTCEPYCRCPIGDGWEVWLFMAAMAFVYAAIKKRHSHQTETVPSRPGCE